MTRPAWQRALLAGATGLALLASARPLVALARALAARHGHPMDLEWMEGAHLYHAHRLLHGLPLYVDPARGFATFPYPPAYWVALAGAGAVLGLDYPAGRTLSLVAMVVVALVLAVATVRRAPARPLGVALAVVAIGGVALSYPLTGGAFDLVRPDAVGLAFPVLAAAALGDGRVSGARAALAGALLTLAIYTKQTGIFFALPLLAFAFTRDRRTFARTLLTTAGLSAGALAILAMLTRGWFLVWLFDQGRHGFRPASDVSPALGAFLWHAPFLAVLPWLVPNLARRGALAPETTKWLALLGGAFVASMLPFAKIGGWFNVLLPFYALGWPVAALVLCDAIRALPQARRASPLAMTLLVAAALLATLPFDAAIVVPTAERRDAAARLIALVDDLPGRVVVTTSPFLAARAKKGDEQPTLQGFADAARAGMTVDYAAALDRSGADWLIVSPAPELDYRPKLADSFELVRVIEFPVQWMPDQPVSLWRRKTRAP